MSKLTTARLQGGKPITHALKLARIPIAPQGDRQILNAGIVADDHQHTDRIGDRIEPIADLRGGSR